MTTRGFWFNAWELNEWAEVDFFIFFYFQGADLFIRWHLKIRNMSVRFTEPCLRLWRLYGLNVFSSYRWLRTSPTRCRKPGFQQRTLSDAAQMRLITVFSGKPRLLSPLCTRPSVRKQRGRAEGRDWGRRHFMDLCVFFFLLFILRRSGGRYLWKDLFITSRSERRNVWRKEAGDKICMGVGWCDSSLEVFHRRRKKSLSNFSQQ